MSERKLRILISGGGTGGGVYPALAAIEVLKTLRPDVQLLWIGSHKGPEHDLVAVEGIPFVSVSGAPIAGVGLRVLTAPFKIGWGLLQSISIVRRFKPAVLLITGGWVTIPPVLACWLLSVPVMIYSPDIEPAGTISVLKRIASKVGVVSLDSARFYHSDQVVDVGYPVRAELLEVAGYDAHGQSRPQKTISVTAAREYFHVRGKQPLLLIVGGSTGARSINRTLIELLSQILTEWQVIHIVGRLDWEWVRQHTVGLTGDQVGYYHSYEYLPSADMARALAAADLVVSRAGASVLGEFPLFGLPAILVPYPHAWRFQKTNADVLVSRGAAVRLDDGRLAEDLLPLLERLRANEMERQRMGDAMRKLRRPDAAARLAAAVLELAQRGSSY